MLRLLCSSLLMMMACATEVVSTPDYQRHTRGLRTFEAAVIADGEQVVFGTSGLGSRSERKFDAPLVDLDGVTASGEEAFAYLEARVNAALLVEVYESNLPTLDGEREVVWPAEVAELFEATTDRVLTFVD